LDNLKAVTSFRLPRSSVILQGSGTAPGADQPGDVRDLRCSGSKRDVIHYYAAIAPVLLAHLEGRALTDKRSPDGEGKAFYEKQAPAHRPDCKRCRWPASPASESTTRSPMTWRPSCSWPTWPP